MKLTILLLIIFKVSAWSPCQFNDGSYITILADNVTIRAECIYLTAPLEWNDIDPNSFNGTYYNYSQTMPTVSLHLKRLLFSAPSIVKTEHIINYWLLNGGGGSQYGMEPFGLSMFREILRNNYHEIFPSTNPIIYLYQYRGAGLSKPAIHCYTSMNWIDCARELIETTIPTSINDSLRIIHAMSNENIAQDLQYQIQYVLNETSKNVLTSTYIYGLSQGTAIIQYYLTIQSIKKQLQPIDGIILDGVMSIQNSDAFQNQMRSINDRFYLYLSKCQNDLNCSEAFHRVIGTDQDVLSVAYTLENLFRINRTKMTCTNDLGLNSWTLLMTICNTAMESIAVRPLAAILIARLYRCSIEDQRVLSFALPIMIELAEKSLVPQLVDPPDSFPDDGNVLSITTIWSDFVGYVFNDNFKDNPTFFNEFCVNSSIINSMYISSTGPMPVCREAQISQYNFSIPNIFQEVLYEKNPRYWSNFQVHPEIFRSKQSGVLLLNGDLDFNSPMYSAQLTKTNFEQANIKNRLVEMKGLTHVTSVQSFTRARGFHSTSCTDQINVQLIYQSELNIGLDDIDILCSLKENLIGIDWLYLDSTVNQTLFNLFGRSTVDYWGIN